MIDLKNTHHHVEFVDLPELRPIELHALFRLSKYLEPFTNRLVMTCDVQTMSGDRIIKQEVKAIDIRSGDLPDIIGCSPLTAHKIMRTFREKNIARKQKAFFFNPKFVRAHNCLGAVTSVNLFDHDGANNVQPAEDVSQVEEI